MKNKYFISLLAILVSLKLFATDYSKTDFGLKTEIQSMNVEVEYLTPDIVRVLKYPLGQTIDKKSLSVVLAPQKNDLKYSENGNLVTIESSELKTVINFETDKVTFYKKNGVELLTEKDYGTQFTPVMSAKKKSYLARQAFLLDKNEAIYGLGEQQNDKLVQRNERIKLQNQNMKICIPYFLSVKGYGVFWDNYASTNYTDNIQETSFESLGKCSDYYFMYGQDANGVVACMRQLTGQVPMIPLWGFGYLQSRERYKNQWQSLKVLRTYRKLKVPIDGIIQDWHYWGPDSMWNSMSFDKKTFPRPQQWIDSIHQLNAHLMIVAWPGFGPKTKQYKEFKAKNMLINFDTWPPHSGTKPYDVYDPAARDIYWKYLYKGLFSLNTDAWWLDSSEPDHINVKAADFDQPTYLGTYRSVINAFPLEHVRGVYEHQRATTSKKRVFILTRSAFAGQQRYGANSWSGDIVASWETLQKQIPAALGFSLCGLPYWNADIGGFFLWNYEGRNADKLNTYKELYTRWIQFGTFTPMMRSHGTDAPREIYQFGKKGEWAYDAIDKYINLRYRMLPYIYSTAWAVTTKSGSFMRALMMDFAADKKVLDIKDEYMFGSSILVAPVVQPMYVNQDNKNPVTDFSKVKTRRVYLPKGADWYDFWTGEKISGGQTVEKPAPIDIMPLYIKAGSILPIGPKVQYASEKKWNKLEIRIYPGANGQFTLYEDEGNNYNYEKGVYSTITFKWNDESKTLSISKRNGIFPGMLKSRKFNIVVVNKNEGLGDVATVKANKTIRYKGKPLVVRL